MNVVAHPDDDLLFLSPDLLDAMRSGAAVRTVYLTAGDDGLDSSYWSRRGLGVEAAYAQMAGVSNAWTTFPSAPDVTAVELRDAPRVSLLFVNLPDGGTGSGFARYGNSSLIKLWTGREPRIRTVDGTHTYTRDTAVALIRSLITTFGATEVRTQDFLGHIGDGDHADHHAVAFFTRQAWAAVSPRPRLVAYQDYLTARRPANVTGARLTAKDDAFLTYAAYDRKICPKASTARCTLHAPFAAWARRQYMLRA